METPHVTCPIKKGILLHEADMQQTSKTQCGPWVDSGEIFRHSRASVLGCMHGGMNACWQEAQIDLQLADF